jgi:large subunit ribosomal protein L10
VPNASKVAEVEAIKGYLTDSVAALLTEYRGLKVKEMGELRDSLRNSSTEYRVLKNTLTGIAIDQVGYKDLLPLLDGPTAMAFVHGDPVQAAKDLAEFARTHPALVLKGGVLDGKVLDAASVRQLATLESREVMLSRLAGMFQASIQRAAVLVSAPLRQVATMTAALRDQREQSEGPVAAEPGAEAAEPGQGESAQAGESAEAGESAQGESAQGESAEPAPPEAAADAGEQGGTGEG